jgi:hypothetical protein
MNAGGPITRVAGWQVYIGDSYIDLLGPLALLLLLDCGCSLLRWSNESFLPLGTLDLSGSLLLVQLLSPVHVLLLLWFEEILSGCELQVELKVRTLDV